jgi:general nucleoside transport system permease protein
MARAVGPMESTAYLSLLLGATLRIAAPIAYAALGATYAERSGVINVGLEGMMLFGAFAAVVASHVTGSAWVGVTAGLLVGLLVAGLLGLACITLHANQIVAGMAVNILALGFTRFGLDVIWSRPGVSPSVAALEPIPIPGLSSLPLLGDALFNQNALVYVLVVLIAASHVVLTRTRFGRHVEAVGEQPAAADSVGILVHRVRFTALLISGALAGLGGVALSLGQLTYFVEAMTAGRGFIGLAANIFGGWTAIGSFLASLLFGLADAAQVALQTAGINLPAQFLLILPYVLTIVAVAGAVSRSPAPLALGRPYHREE